jgi:hypothetical protein
MITNLVNTLLGAANPLEKWYALTELYQASRHVGRLWSARDLERLQDLIWRSTSCDIMLMVGILSAIGEYCKSSHDQIGIDVLYYFKNAHNPQIRFTANSYLNALGL